MKSEPKSYRLICHVLWLFMLWAAFPPAHAEAGEIVAIVNKGQKVSSLTIKDLQLIYKGKKKTWNNGQPIVLFLPPPKSNPMRMLTKDVFRVVDESEISVFYLQAVFQQVFVNPPKSVPNTRYAVIEVAATPGAIAIVEKDKLPDDSEVSLVPLTNGFTENH